MGVLRSIRFRLTLWYVLLLAAILAAFSAGVYLTLRHNLAASLDDSLENRTAVLLAAVRYEAGRPTLEGVVSAADPDADEQVAQVYDAQGGLSFDGSGAGHAFAIRPRAIQDALAGQPSASSARAGDETMRLRIVPIDQSGAIRGVLVVGRSEEDMAETLNTLLLILAMAYPATLVAATAGGVFLAGRALSPIDSITRLAQRMSAEDLSQRLDASLPRDEVGNLARTFNDMIARLDGAFRRQRQFTADASHELRTPLTTLKGQVEVALSRERDAAAYRAVLQTVNEEVDRLIRLVGSLLTLARADAGEIPLASDAVDLADVVAGALEQVRAAADDRRIALHVEGAPGLALQADQDFLLQLLLNLLDNALKYTGPGGDVTVGWRIDGATARLWVRDTGAGIAAEHLGRVFDRFYRVDPARSRAEGGAGLGLSMSRWIAEAHGGELAIESEPGKGTTVEVRLPNGRPARR
jgi:heavy metal sensor kinase